MSGTPRLLDLFCGAGGAAKGYSRAGFYVVGVDIHDQPRYCGDEFYRDDALSFVDPEHVGIDFDAIHASPPCQAYSALRTMPNRGTHPELVEETRALLVETGLPYVIENVPGAPLIEPITICGRSLGGGTKDYQLRRHRLFECNFAVLAPPCACDPRAATIGIYGDKARDRRRSKDISRSHKIALASEAMGIDWMDWRGLTQAIPPVYTELIGAQLLDHLRARSAA